MKAALGPQLIIFVEALQKGKKKDWTHITYKS